MKQLGLNFELAGLLKEEGIARAARGEPLWLDLMRAEARRYAEAHGEVCADDLREYDCRLDTLGIKPRHFNAWGSLFRGDEWEFVRFTTSARTVGHRNTIRVWRLK